MSVAGAVGLAVKCHWPDVGVGGRMGHGISESPTRIGLADSLLLTGNLEVRTDLDSQLPATKKDPASSPQTLRRSTGSSPATP